MPFQTNSVVLLFVDGSFEKQLREQFEGGFTLRFHMAVPFAGRRGRPAKMTFGPWLMTGMRVLARLRFLRGTAFDPFGLSRERRIERQLIRDYEKLLREMDAVATRENLDTVIELARLAEAVRGYGHVKLAAIIRMQARRDALLETLRRPARPTSPGAKGKDRVAALPLPQ